MREGQLEMIGVLVIVVIFLFIGLIFAKFVANKPENAYSDIRKNIKAANIVNGLIKLDFDGKRLSNWLLECSSIGDCDSVKAKIEEVMRLIGERSYIFTAKEGGNNILNIGSCEGDKISYNYPLTLEGREININLILCSQS